MLDRGRGKIIFIASLLTFQGGINVPGYAASKGGIGQLTMALANEWAGRGVNVNAIAPGYIETDVTAALRADSQRNPAILQRIPAGRWGKPEDLQGAVVYLASKAADYAARLNPACRRRLDGPISYRATGKKPWTMSCPATWRPPGRCRRPVGRRGFATSRPPMPA